MMNTRDELWYLKEVCRIIVEDYGQDDGGYPVGPEGEETPIAELPEMGQEDPRVDVSDGTVIIAGQKKQERRL